ncbi:hypothetical protein CDAR_7781, partial [Caerostris darwini]
MNPFPAPYITFPPTLLRGGSLACQARALQGSLFLFFLMSSSRYIFQVGSYNGHAIVKEGPSGKRFRGKKKGGKRDFSVRDQGSGMEKNN